MIGLGTILVMVVAGLAVLLAVLAVGLLLRDFTTRRYSRVEQRLGLGSEDPNPGW